MSVSHDGMSRTIGKDDEDVKGILDKFPKDE